MTFFNKKEEVLEIKLTSFGKQKLAAGKFKPAYYAFFDDDILYDGARSGFYEDNNNIEPRIQENTPSMRVQTSFSDLEQKVKKQTHEVVNGVFRESNTTDLKSDPSVFQDEDGLRNVLPLGNSQMGNKHVAAWHVEALNYEFKKIEPIINDPNKKPILNIPQLDMDMVVKPIIAEKDFVGVIDPKTNKFVIEQDGHYIRIEGDMVVFEFSENNVDLLNDAFSIEVYEVITEDSEEILRPKMFKKRTQNIVDGILLDESEVDSQIDVTPVDDRFVEFYFDVTTDNDIDNTTKKEIIEKRDKKGSIFDKAFKPSTAAQIPGGRLYTTDNTGEDC
tara:strand:+ start:992 stop:1987 length:996 start_codon:yes stop_codon:yes gene_type:complete